MRKGFTAVVVTLAMLGAACAGGGDDEDGAGGGEEPVRGGTLVAVGFPGPLPGQGSLNPAVNTQGGMQQAAGLLFSGLVEIDDKAQPVPELATRWDVRDGGRTYEFTLRDGVRWHDGRPLTAADVKFSYEAALLRNHARTQSSIGPALAQPCAPAPAPPSCPSIEATEATGGQPAKVVFRFGQPYAPLLQQLTHTDGAVIPKHVWDGKPPPTAATPWPQGQNPVGTGPFKFVSHNASEIVFDRNPDYFRQPLPYLDRVVQRAIPTPAAQVQALTAGEVDWLWSVRGQDLPALRGNPNIRVVTGSQSAGGSTNCVLKLAFNLAQEGVPPAQVRQGNPPPHPVLGDVRVRRALAHGLNTDEYVQQVLQNDGGRLATGPIHSAMAWAHANAPIPKFDQGEAGRLLDDAGWTSPAPGQPRAKAGTPLVIDMYHFAGNEADLATKIQQNLAPLGVRVELRQVDPPARTPSTRRATSTPSSCPTARGPTPRSACGASTTRAPSRERRSPTAPATRTPRSTGCSTKPPSAWASPSGARCTSRPRSRSPRTSPTCGCWRRSPTGPTPPTARASRPTAATSPRGPSAVGRRGVAE